MILFEILPTMTSLIVATFLGFGALRGADRGRAAVHRPRRPEQPELGDDALLGAEQRGALRGHAAVGDRARASASRCSAPSFALLNYAFDEISSPALRVRKLDRARIPERLPAAREPVRRRRRAGAEGRGAHASRTRPTPARWSPSTTSTSSSRAASSSRIVGESGCGKSTLLYAIARLLGSPLPGEIVGGRVLFQGQDLVLLEERELRRVRWRDLSVVMQSAMNALNPVLTVAEQMRDACRAHSKMSKAEIEERSREVLRLVSIDPVHLHSYPHQLSGGMRQRAMIAMALLFTPDLVIMDEPTSALDVVAQRSLMVQIKELQERLGFAVIFVTHDMSLVSHFSDRLLVMYAGQVAEMSETRRAVRPAAPPLLAGPARGVPVDPRPEGRAARDPRLAARPRSSARGVPVRAQVRTCAEPRCTRPRCRSTRSTASVVRCVLAESER